MLGTGALNFAIGIDWGGVSSTDSADSIGLLGVSISVGKIAQFCGAITSRYISKRDLVNDTILCKILTISYAYAFRLLVLRLQARLNSLCRSSMDTIYTAALANFCLSALENINLFIP